MTMTKKSNPPPPASEGEDPQWLQDDDATDAGEVESGEVESGDGGIPLAPLKKTGVAGYPTGRRLGWAAQTEG